MSEDDETRPLLAATLTGWLREAFLRAFPDVASAEEAIYAVATSSAEFGDYQCNAAMGLAKALKCAPRQIAERVVAAADDHEAVASIEIAGPGFLNIRLATDWLAGWTERLGRDERLGVPLVGSGCRIVMDYGGPNITKPLHIGHLRTHDIGSALDRMHRFMGYEVIADSHLGDWGTQFGITIMGYRHFGDAEAMRTRPLEELERVYVKSYERGEADATWRAACRAELVKLQNGDAENTALWQTFVTHSLESIERLYERLGVRFDLTRGESYYHGRLHGLLDRLEAAGLAAPSEGATVVFLEDEKLPVCIVRKSDGAFNYATTDIATVESRVEEFAPDRIVYITDERQQLHFKQVFAICRRMGLSVRMDHIWFGIMRLPEGTFSTREGNVIKLDAFLDEAEARALAIVQKTSPDMAPAQQREIARMVGVGAVKYADLSQNPQSIVTFTWEKAMALDGNSAPYLQYAHARIASVRDKFTERFPARDADAAPLRLGEPVERELALKLARFPDVVLMATEQYKPNAIADYLYELAQCYSTFYQNVPFLKAEEGPRESRVRLCGIVARVLRQGLDLLGIEAPARI